MSVSPLPNNRPCAARTPSASSSCSSTFAYRTRRGRSPCSEIHCSGRVSANLREGPVDLLELHVFGRRYPELLKPESRKLRGQIHQLVRLGIGKGPQDDAIDD